MNPARVEALADHGDLAVHHPAGAHDVDAGAGLGDRHLGVHLERRVVVDRAVGGEDTAVAVVGELVEAQVRHHRQRVTHLGLDVADRDVEDAVGVHGAGPAGVLGRRDAEEHDAAEAELGCLGSSFQQRVTAVLDDARHGRDGHRLGRALADEHGQHQLRRHQRRLRHEVPQRRGAPQPSRPDHRSHRSPPGLRWTSCRGVAGATARHDVRMVTWWSRRPCGGWRDGARTAW